MGESACLIHSLDNYSEANQVTSSLGESVSFGRFATESLSWEKWSTFSHKRYVEEAERYAQPGSVAQKKAFFEAHYKKIAAKKAAEEAALREQELALNTNPEPESEGESCITSIKIPENVEVEPIAELENLEKAVSEEMKEDDIVEKIEKKEVLNMEMVSEMAEMEKPLLKDFKSTSDASSPISKKRANSPSSKALAQRKTPKIPAPPPVKRTLPTHHRRTLSESLNRNLSFRKPLPNNPISPAKHTVPIPTMREKNATPTAKISKSSDANRSARKTGPKIPISPAKHTVPIPNMKNLAETISQNRRTPNLLPKIPVSPAKSTASINLKKETNSARKKWESPVVSTSMKKSAMKSLRTLIYSTPSKESDKSTLPSAKRAESSRVACETPSRTPLMNFTKGESKNTSAAPFSENRRIRTPQEAPASGGKATRPKWNILSAVCSRPLSAQKNKLQSPTLLVPFNLRTEERAARRKQKLEEKFNEKAMPKVQLQTKIMEKAETELRRWRRSLCFRARPLPDFYKEKETPKEQIQVDLKVSIGHPEAPKLGKEPTYGAAKSIVSLSSTLDINSSRNSDFKNVIQKAKGVRNLLTSLPENTSPNIKH